MLAAILGFLKELASLTLGAIWKVALALGITFFGILLATLGFILLMAEVIR